MEKKVHLENSSSKKWLFYNILFQLTTDATSAAGQLLHRMNAVMSAVVGSNFVSDIFSFFIWDSLQNIGTSFGLIKSKFINSFSIGRIFCIKVLGRALPPQANFAIILFLSATYAWGYAERDGLKESWRHYLHYSYFIALQGSSSHDSLGELYDSIDREQSGMILHCEDVSYWTLISERNAYFQLSLLFFARSFAVVIEEAVRRVQQANTVGGLVTVDRSVIDCKPRIR